MAEIRALHVMDSMTAASGWGNRWVDRCEVARPSIDWIEVGTGYVLSSPTGGGAADADVLVGAAAADAAAVRQHRGRRTARLHRHPPQRHHDGAPPHTQGVALLRPGACCNAMLFCL